MSKIYGQSLNQLRTSLCFAEMERNLASNDTSYLDPVPNYGFIRYVSATILLVTSILGVCGNTLNFVVLKKLTSISEPRKVLFIFLSVADITFSISVIPAVPAAIMNRWPLGFGTCVFSAYLLLVSFNTSAWLLFLITCECYIAVCRPFVYPTFVTKTRCTKLCFIVTISMYIGVLLSLAFGSRGPFSDVRFYKGIGTCLFDIETKGVHIYFVYALGVAKYIFAFVMVVIQCKIAHVARNQARRIAQQEQHGRLNSLPSAPEESLPEREQVDQRRSSELKGVYVCMAVSASFFLSWLPTLTWLMYAMGQKGHVSLLPLLPLSWLCSSQCWTNTLIYMLLKKNYRRTMWTILEQVLKKFKMSERTISLET